MSVYRCGAEVAGRAGFASLLGRRAAVLCNPTSLLRRPARGGRLHLVDALRDAGVEVVRLFGPEHGLWSAAQDMVGVDSGLDPVFGLPVLTLYGHDEATLWPRPEALAGAEVLVFDVQDVGARYYTYAATLCMALDVCARAGVEVVVLDRANPLGGEIVEGNRVGAGFRSLVGWLDLPQRHGLTVGELARLHAVEAGVDVDLHVVPCAGWEVGCYLDEQDNGDLLPAWTCPSPNMPTLETALLYPGGCLVEGTVLSEGRGTTRPFELIGAPGIEPAALCAALDAHEIPGLRARPYVFEPTFQKHAGRVCGGVCLEVADRLALPAVRAGLAVIEAARTVAPEVFAWRTETYEFVSDRLAFDLLMGGTAAREALEAGRGLEAACADFEDARSDFAARATPCLLYARGRGPLS